MISQEIILSYLLIRDNLARQLQHSLNKSVAVIRERLAPISGWPTDPCQGSQRFSLAYDTFNSHSTLYCQSWLDEPQKISVVPAQTDEPLHRYPTLNYSTI